MAGSQTVLGSVNAICNFKSIGQHSLCAEGVYNPIIILNFSSPKPASPALPLFLSRDHLALYFKRKYTTEVYEYMPLAQILTTIMFSFDAYPWLSETSICSHPDNFIFCCYCCYCFCLKHEMRILLSRTFFWGKIFQYFQAHCTRVKFFFSESSSLLDNMSFYYDFLKELFIKQKHLSEISKTGQYFHMCTQSFSFSGCLVAKLCLILLWPCVSP